MIILVRGKYRASIVCRPFTDRTILLNTFSRFVATGAAIGQSKVESNAEIWLPVGIIFGTGIGAGVGAIIGATRRKREVIYSAP